MKIKKRILANPMATISLWLIPTLTYVMGKLGGMEYNQYEWVWWVGTPILFSAWFILNYKVVKEN